MNLKFNLSKANTNLCEIGQNEEIYYCLPMDIDLSDDFIEDSYTVVTNKRIIVLEKGVKTHDLKITDCEKIMSEPQISCGILYAVVDGKEQLLGRFSSKHLVRYSYLIRGCQLIQKGSEERAVSTEYERSCPKCHRALPNTSECIYCSGKKGGVLPIIMSMVGCYKKKLAVIFFFMLLATSVTLGSPAVQRFLVDNVLMADKKSVKEAVICLSLMFIMSFGIVFINTTKSNLCAKLGAIIARDQRRKLYEKYQILSLSFINDRRPGELMNRVIYDTQRVSFFFSDVFCNMFTVSVLFICVIIFMLVLNWKLALIAFCLTPISFFISMAFRKKIKARFHLLGAKSDSVNSGLQDVLSGMLVVKAYGQEKKESAFFDQATDDYARVMTRNEVFFAIFYPILTFLLGTGIYLVTYFGGVQVLHEEMSPGELLQFISYASLLYQYVGWISNMPRTLMNMITSLERISDVLNQEPQIVNDKDAKCIDIKGKVEFKDASFGYKTYNPVLEHINFSVKPGEMIGFVGASGTGKSTMINLIMHLYEVDGGAVYIDDNDIRKIDLKNFHSQLGVVLQENFLFSGTILNNIKFAKPDATYEEIIKAAKMANAHDFILKTPDGYNTYVGEHGYNLSGGERQRIAIARAILNNPKILILDEATASLDTESEYLIQKALQRLTVGKTTFAIAHRLSTLKDADRIVVIDGHEIAEIGSHEELLNKKGIYYNLVQAQLKMQKK